MISCDTNILFPACDRDHALHEQARAFLSSHTGDQEFVLCEQVLTELYCLLRNPAVSRPPMKAADAAGIIQSFRGNPAWRIVDVPGDRRIMDAVWKKASESRFAYRRIFDVRLAGTLLAHGVTRFATCNLRDFKDAGFDRVWNPLS